MSTLASVHALQNSIDMATWTGQTKSSLPTYTNGTRHSSTFANDQKPSSNPPAVAGQYYGFGAFTYSGGQALVYAATQWTNLTEH